MDQVALHRVHAGHRATLENLLQLYCHDLSACFALQVGSDGRYAHPAIEPYFAAPDRHFAYFIFVGTQLSGFVLATRGSPATERSEDLDVAEFFTLKAARRHGVGKAAAFALWDFVPGHWVVRVAERNTAGLAFWRRAIAQYAHDAHAERTMMSGEMTRTVFEFDTRPRS